MRLVLFGFLLFFVSTITLAYELNIDSVFFSLQHVESNENKVDKLLYASLELESAYNDTSLYLINEAFNLAKNIGYDEGIINSYFYFGRNFFLYGENYNQAAEYFYKCIDYYEKVRDYIKLAETYNYLGYIFYRLKDNDQALSYYYKSLEFSFSSNHRYELGITYNYIGNYFHSRVENYDSALVYYNKALEIFEELNDSNEIAHQYNNLGNIYLYRLDYDRSFKYYMEGIKICERNHLDKYLILLYSSLGNYFTWIKNEDEAIRSWMKVIDIIDEKNVDRRVLYATNRLVQLFDMRGDTQKVYKYYVLHNSFKEQVDKRRNARMISQYKWQYELQKQKREDEVRQMIIFISIFVPLAFVIMFTIFYFNAKVKRVRLRQENLRLEKKILSDKLDFKNQKLISQAIYLARNSSLINSIIEKLTQTKYDLKKQNQKSIEDIITNLKLGLKRGTLEEFDTHFTHVHATFFNKLSENFPTLTLNERRLCAFLKLNMSSKEIASITYKSIDSVESARKRLRKKLNLKPSVNLISFISQI